MIIAKRIIRLILSPALAVGICAVMWFAYVSDVIDGVFDDCNEWD